jgi:hypothetical protein
VSEVELLELVCAALGAAYDPDPWRVVEVLAARCPVFLKHHRIRSVPVLCCGPIVDVLGG